MKMNDYINDFTSHIREAIEIAKNTHLTENTKEFKNVLICGLGGSGIGGTIVNNIVSQKQTYQLQQLKIIVFQIL